MPPLHSGQKAIRQAPERFKVVACGRRFGKTLLGCCLCFETALSGDIAWWVAPDYPRASIGWRMMLRLAKQIPGTQIVRSEKMIILPSGGWIQVKSARDPDSLRGEGISRVVVDECADVQEEAWEEALAPALTDKLGDAVFIGTPKGRNWFYRKWRLGNEDDDWVSFQMPTHANPYIDDNELRRIERTTAARIWRQEYLAEFVTFEGRVYETFDPGGPMVFSDPPDLGKYDQFFGGIDFGFRNPTAMVVGGRTSDGTIDIIDEVYESRLKPEEMREQIARLTAQYDVVNWWGDAADPRMIDFLADEGIPIEASPRSSGTAETFVQYEVRLVSGLLEEDPPGIRFYAGGCPHTIDEHDQYRYPSKRANSVEKETPLKVNDHACNAVQYLVHGLDEYFADVESGMLTGDTFRALDLPQ